MNSSEICRFCEIASGNYRYIGVDEPFASDDNFIALASIGALVEGWSLIIPKTHHLSMRNFYSLPKFCDFMKLVLPKIIENYGSLIAFEHGANIKNVILTSNIATYTRYMHPKNQIKSKSGAFFDWLGDFDSHNGAKSSKHFHKRKCRRIVRRDGNKQIKQELDIA